MDKRQIEHYLQQTNYTDPLEYSYMYEAFSNNITEICYLVNQQLIHPAKLNQYPDVTPNESEIWNNEPKTAYEILKKLTEKSKNGIIDNKANKDRVIITCRGFTLLLVSVLRYKGIPARARAGFAPYILNNGINIDHWICEYWDITKEQWMLLDADFLKVDFPKTEFKYVANVYLDALEGKINPLDYGWDESWGMAYIISYLNIDLLSILYGEPWYNPKTELTESLHWELKSEFSSAVRNLSSKDVKLIRKVAELLLDPDKNFYHLKELLIKNQKLMPIK
jgi:hypothetical protein